MCNVIVRSTTNSVTAQHPLQNTLGACSSASAVPCPPPPRPPPFPFCFAGVFFFFFFLWEEILVKKPWFFVFRGDCGVGARGGGGGGGEAPAGACGGILILKN